MRKKVLSLNYKVSANFFATLLNQYLVLYNSCPIAFSRFSGSVVMWMSVTFEIQVCKCASISGEVLPSAARNAVYAIGFKAPVVVEIFECDSSQFVGLP